MYNCFDVIHVTVLKIMYAYITCESLCLLDRAVESGAPPLLCGKVSRDIKQVVENTIGNPRGEKLRWFSECFSVSILQT